MEERRKEGLNYASKVCLHLQNFVLINYPNLGAQRERTDKGRNGETGICSATD